MPILSTELKYFTSVDVGPGGSTANTTPDTSLGGFVSSSVIPNATLDNVFDDITGPENSGDQVDYQCIFVANTDATLALSNAVVYIPDLTAGGAQIAIAIDNIGPTAMASASAQAAVIANSLAAPVGTTSFSTPTTQGAGLNVGNIEGILNPLTCCAVWVQRTATGGSALDNDSLTIAFVGDTPS